VVFADFTSIFNELEHNGVNWASVVFESLSANLEQDDIKFVDSFPVFIAPNVLGNVATGTATVSLSRSFFWDNTESTWIESKTVDFDIDDLSSTDDTSSADGGTSIADGVVFVIVDNSNGAGCSDTDTVFTFAFGTLDDTDKLCTETLS